MNLENVDKSWKREKSWKTWKNLKTRKIFLNTPKILKNVEKNLKNAKNLEKRDKTWKTRKILKKASKKPWKTWKSFLTSKKRLLLITGKVITWGWKAYATPTSRLCSPRLISVGLLTNFASCVFVVGLVWRILYGDWIEPLQLRRHIFFKTLISRSYLINFQITGGFSWTKRTVCYSQLNLTSDRLLSD